MDSGLYHKVVKVTCWNQLEIELAKLLTQVRVNLMHLDIVAIPFAAQRIGYDICLPRRVLNINRVLSNGLKPYPYPQVQVIEAKVSRCFDEMVEIDYGGDDFHDPTTNVRRRCALAIAKPTPRGY